MNSSTSPGLRALFLCLAKFVNDQLANAIKDHLRVANDCAFHRGKIGVMHQATYVMMKEPRSFLN